jgi:hypothetical protein
MVTGEKSLVLAAYGSLGLFIFWLIATDPGPLVAPPQEQATVWSAPTK